MDPLPGKPTAADMTEKLNRGTDRSRCALIKPVLATLSWPSIQIVELPLAGELNPLAGRYLAIDDGARIRKGIFDVTHKSAGFDGVPA